MSDINRTQIVLPKVAPHAEPEVQGLAEAIDRVFQSLTDQMRNFEAADATELSGVPASSVISGANSMYFQTFENPVQDDWNLRSGAISGIT